MIMRFQVQVLSIVLEASSIFSNDVEQPFLLHWDVTNVSASLISKIIFEIWHNMGKYRPKKPDKIWQEAACIRI